MSPNDVLRAVRYMLDLGDAHVVRMIAAAGPSVPATQVAAWLRREDEPGYQPMPDAQLAAFLDGLVRERRGPSEQAPRAPESRLSNNLVLKKLRVAFALKEDDLKALLAAAGFAASSAELNALFRKPSHPNYRPCGDQLLRNVLKGLTLKLRG